MEPRGKRLARGRVLKHSSRNGYHYVFLQKDGEVKAKRVHRLVAQAFIPNPENKIQVNHIDGDKANNRVENLEWVTAKENIRHAINNGLKKDKRKVIRSDGAVSDSMSEAAKNSGTYEPSVCKCCNGERKTANGYSFAYVD